MDASPFPPLPFSSPVKGKGIYLRRAAGQIHAIQFQASRWGGVYFVNVGFSYDFLPGEIAMQNGDGLDYTKFGLLDLLISVRLGNLCRARTRANGVR